MQGRYTAEAQKLPRGFACLRFCGSLFLCFCLHAATFGTRVPVAGGPLDLVLDERRNQLYLVDFNNNQVQVYSIPGRRFLPPVKTGSQPVGGALSADGKFLYVTNFGGSSLSVIDLDQNAVVRTINVPAPPEGIAVGGDGRVVFTTLSPAASLVVFDPAASTPADQLAAVVLPPAPPTPPQLPAVVPGRNYLSFRGRLQATPDGRLIIGMNTPTNATTVVFVYEVASGQVLRARTVPNASSVLSVSPDGSRFMAGLYLFDTATLNVLAQQNANNAPFVLAGNFNLIQNVGGSVFSPDGSTLYSAFNIAPPILPQPPPNAATLLVSNPRNLGIKMGIQLPENVLGKMAASSDGGSVYALSDSGLLILPVGSINNFPILAPETTAVRLTASQCDRSGATRSISIRNAGRGNLRFTVNPVAANSGLTVQAEGAQALRFTMNPAAARQLGSSTTQVQLSSQEAINIPPLITVYQNWQNAETRTPAFPIETAAAAAEGLMDVLVDDTRQRVYIANSGKNQVEVFDIRRQALLSPIEVGQFPHSMALGSDGRTLYVANAGGESISMVDLDAGQVYDRVVFPAVPFSASVGPSTPKVIAPAIYGLQIFASAGANTVGQNGQLWTTAGKTAIPRPLSNAIGTLNIPAPASMTATADNRSVMLLAGNGIAYLYDSLADDYVLARTVMSAPFTSFYGAVAAGPGGQYYLANRAILNSALVPIGGYAGGTAATTPAPGGGGGGFPGGGVIIILPGGGTGGAGGLPGFPGGGGGAPAAPAALRDVPAVYPIDATTYAQFSTPQQSSATAAPTGVPQPLLQLIDVNTAAVRASIAVAEGPPMTVFGNQRANVPSRWMAVDNRGANAYVVTSSGLTVVPLSAGRPAGQIAINSNGVVNGATYAPAIAPGSLISIFGQNMADHAAAGSLPLPAILGGSCVTFNNASAPLLMTSPTQVNAQVPPDLKPGSYSVVVRSVQNPLASNAVQVTVSAAAPGLFATAAGDAAIFHASDMRQVTQDNPAHRDEVLTLFATGLPPAAGVTLPPGAPSPFLPLVTTIKPRVFIGNPGYKQAEMIVNFSGFAPGFVGLNQINITVPGDHINGDRLPVVIEAGGARSPSSGPLVPVTYVQ
jgi:uncharacterized protein (TIGR03437 family)